MRAARPADEMTSAPATCLRRGAWVLAVTWLVVVGVASLLPALAHGEQLGGYSLLARFGLGTVPGVVPSNVVASDQVQEFAAWTVLAWREVHAGHLPLWNPFSGMGLPLAFNFQSAPASLPMLVAYLFPVRLAYTVVIAVKVVIAGTGAAVLCRVLRLPWWAATFAGTIFELCGAFSSALGWPISGVFCWTGWVLAAALAVVSGRHRWRHTVLLAVTLGFSFYGGHPESSLLLVVTVAAVATAVAVIESKRARPALWALARLGGAGLLGTALAAPLILPGAQVLLGSARSSFAGPDVIPTTSAVGLAVSGYYGFPAGGRSYFGPGNYYGTAAYVGPIVLVLAALAVWRWWRRPAVAVLAVAAVVLAAVAYLGPLERVLQSVPGLRLVLWNRALVPLGLMLAVLAAIGLHTLATGSQDPRVRRGARVLAGLACAAVAALAARQLATHGGADSSWRDDSLLWPAISVVVLVVSVFVVTRDRRGSPRRTASATVALAAVVAAEVAFLLTAAPQVEPSSSTGFVATPAERTLQAVAGARRVGFGLCPSVDQQPSLGILAEANDAYGVDELAVYDPVVPHVYYGQYARASGTRSGALTSSNFCPSITSARVARLYGVSLVLEPAGAKGPVGTTPAGAIGNETVFSVPGGSVATLSPEGRPADSSSATPVAVSWADPDAPRLEVRASTPSTLALHIAAFPGWSARLDGKPLALRRLSGDQLEATVPAGTSTVVLTYRPRSFDAGLAVAAVALLVLLLGVGLPWRGKGSHRLRRS